MTSNQDQNMKNNIQILIEELRLYNHKNKVELLHKYIQERLDKSLIEYYSQLNEAFSRLANYSEKKDLSLMKKLNKE